MPDVAHIESAISHKTKAIVFSHWSGDVGEIERIHRLAMSRGIALIEDASEAFGATLDGQPLNARFADYTVYSFGPVRQITCGEGAVLIANTPDKLERLRRIRRYGIDQKTFRLESGDLNPASDIPRAGFNFPFNNIGATLGIRQLSETPAVIERYRSNGAYYENALQGTPGLNPLNRRINCQSGYWTFSFRAENRDALVRKLVAAGISCQRLHVRNDRYTFLSQGNASEDLPGVTVFDRENISIPVGWWLTDADRQLIASSIREGW